MDQERINYNEKKTESRIIEITREYEAKQEAYLYQVALKFLYKISKHNRLLI